MDDDESSESGDILILRLLKRSTTASQFASERLLRLTVVLVFLTAVLTVLTGLVLFDAIGWLPR